MASLLFYPAFKGVTTNEFPLVISSKRTPWDGTSLGRPAATWQAATFAEPFVPAGNTRQGLSFRKMKSYTS